MTPQALAKSVETLLRDENARAAQIADLDELRACWARGPKPPRCARGPHFA